MAGRVGLRHEPAEGHAVDDRLLDAQRVAEHPHIVAPLRQIPVGRVSVLAAAIAAVVEVDDLCDVGEGRERRLEKAVVEARPPMQQQDGGPLAHRRPIRHEAKAFHIEIQAYAVHADKHGEFSRGTRQSTPDHHPRQRRAVILHIRAARAAPLGAGGIPADDYTRATMPRTR